MRDFADEAVDKIESMKRGEELYEMDEEVGGHPRMLHYDIKNVLTMP